MSEKNSIVLLNSFIITPDRLTEAVVRVPHTDRYIPVQTNGTFEKLTPTIEALGDGAVKISLDNEPFGFMRGSDLDYRVYSQKTEDIVIEPADSHQWKITLNTPEPITDIDSELFSNGLDVYASFVAKALKIIDIDNDHIY